jgi:hypothetical protein
VPRGWETWLRVRGQKDGYGVHTTYTDAFYLYLDSESLAINQEINENNAKIVQGRAVLESARTLQAQDPGGQFTFQPRADDCLGILAGHFQCYRSVDGGGSVAGTYVFNHLTGQPDWSGTLVTGGDPWNAGAAGTGTYADAPTDVCALTVEQYFGNSITGSNGRRFVDAVVSQLEFSAAVGEELKMTPTIMAGSFALCDFVPATDDPPVTIGSYSVLGAFQYHHGTITAGGQSRNLSSFRITSNNQVEGKKVIGKKTPVSFPFGRTDVTGEFEMEFDDDVFIQAFLKETTGTVTGVFYNGADKMTITANTVKYNEVTTNVSDGEALVNQTVPFKAFGYSGLKTLPPLEVEVACSNVLVGGTTFFPL